MELFDNLMLGFTVAFTPENLLYALLGCVLGTLIGVLPGIGPVPTIAMLLPITYVLPPVAGLIMLAGIYWRPVRRIHHGHPGGAAWETSAVVTVLDGHQMARNGRAGAAWRSPPWVRSSPAAWPRCCWPPSRPRWPKSPSSSVPPNTSR